MILWATARIIERTADVAPEQVHRFLAMHLDFFASRGGHGAAAGRPHVAPPPPDGDARRAGPSSRRRGLTSVPNRTG